jgi:hypothetical protein
MNLSLASCSSAELASVSIHQGKIQLKKLYLQLVKKDSHLPCHESTIRHWGIELVLKIVHYRVEMIKYPLKLIEEELKLMDPARINRTGRAD